MSTLIITLESQIIRRDFTDYDLIWENSDEEIITAIADSVEESSGIDIRNLYTVVRDETNEEASVFPKSPAGIKLLVEEAEDSDGIPRHRVKVNGEELVTIGRPESEDAIIGRDLISGHDIVEYMKIA